MGKEVELERCDSRSEICQNALKLALEIYEKRLASFTHCHQNKPYCFGCMKSNELTRMVTGLKLAINGREEWTLWRLLRLDTSK